MLVILSMYFISNALPLSSMKYIFLFTKCYYKCAVQLTIMSSETDLPTLLTFKTILTPNFNCINKTLHPNSN